VNDQPQPDPDDFVVDPDGSAEQVALIASKAAPDDLLITFIRCHPTLIAAKRVYADGQVADYANPKQWMMRDTAFKTILNASLYLRNRIVPDPRIAAVNAMPVPGLNPDQSHQRILERAIGDGGPLRARSTVTLFFDLDKWQCPKDDPTLWQGNRFNDAAKRVRQVLASAWSAFGQAAMIALPSASSGLREGLISMRLILRLSDPLTARDKKALTAALKRRTKLPLDPCVCNDNQPIYLARPVFEGRADPISASDHVVFFEGYEKLGDVALLVKEGSKIIAARDKAVKALGGDFMGIAKKAGSDGEYRSWLASAVGAAVARGVTRGEVIDALVEWGRTVIPEDRQRSYWNDRHIGEMYDDFVERDIRKDKVAPSAAALRPQGAIANEDFVAYLPDHSYICRITRQFWSKEGVDAALPGLPSLTPNGRAIPAHQIVDQQSPVIAVSWLPGEDEVVKDLVVIQGGRITRQNCNTYNLYLPPTIVGVPCTEDDVKIWLDHIKSIYPDGHKRIVQYNAFKVRFPGVKINFALVLTGGSGIGKDSWLEPVKQAVGPWNFAEVKPSHILKGDWTEYYQSVIARISEVKDLGEGDRYNFHDATKTLFAAPPDTLEVNGKYAKKYWIPNVFGALITSNHKTGGLYLPPDDRRHEVYWSDKVEGDYTSAYWDKLWNWYQNENGFAKVAYYLRHVVDLSDFNPKASPPKTEAFWAIVYANTGEETTDLAQLIELLGTPQAITLDTIVSKAKITSGFEGTAAWFSDSRHYRIVSEKFEKCGYRVFRNDRDTKHGQWQFGNKRRSVYVIKGLSDADAEAAIGDLQKGIVRKTEAEPPEQPPEPPSEPPPRDDLGIPF
jgi:hypothetical protein